MSQPQRQGWREAQASNEFRAQMADFWTHYVGRPSPLYFAERLTAHYGGAKIYFKRDELNHTGAHKINNCLGQVLLARRMAKTRIIAETGAGQHGVATATMAARFGLPCVVKPANEGNSVGVSIVEERAALAPAVAAARRFHGAVIAEDYIAGT